MSDDYAYYKTIFQNESMPFAYVDLNRFDQNVDDIAGRCPEKTIRIASKSVRCVALIRRILERNSRYQGVMTYMPRETRFLCDEGFDDFLMGYPAWRRDDIASLADPIKQGKTVRFMVDSIDHINHLDAIGRDHDVRFRACIDLDMSSEFPGLYFGVRRSGITTPEQAVAVAERAKKCDHVVVDALMGYEAQIAGLPDKVPGKGVWNAFVRFLKRRSINEISARRKAVVDALKSSGVELEVVNGGGTGSVESTIEEPHVTEVTVGSGFYTPTLFDAYARFRHWPAVGYAIEITRRPKPNVYTCHGGGYVASGGVGRDKEPKPYLPEGATLIAQEGAGEVQTPVVYEGPVDLALGDPVFMRYAKAGEFCERFNELVAISEGAIVDRYPTYRGQGQQFC